MRRSKMKVVVVIVNFLLLRFVKALPSKGSCPDGDMYANTGQICPNGDSNKNKRKGFCPHSDDPAYDNVHIVITDRAQETGPNDMYAVNALYTPEERTRVMKFTGDDRNGGKNTPYETTVTMEEEVITVKIDKTKTIRVAQILYNVRYCSGEIFYGLKGIDSTGKKGMSLHNNMGKYLTKKKLIGGDMNLLLYAHGIGNDAKMAIKSCDDFNYKHQSSTNYHAVPIIWSTSTSGNVVNTLNICQDKEKNAPAAADKFATDIWPILYLVEKANIKMSFMSHSLGNYLLSMFAQYIGENPETANTVKPFEEIFMVAPCLRNNIFDGDENQMDKNKVMKSFPYENDQIYDMHEMNGGNHIASLAQNGVHVLWSRTDTYLHLYHKFPVWILVIFAFISIFVYWVRSRRAWKASVIIMVLGFVIVAWIVFIKFPKEGLTNTNGFTGCSDYQALGVTGDKAEEKLASNLKGKVTFHKMNWTLLKSFKPKITIGGHSYQFDSDAVEIYKKCNK